MNRQQADHQQRIGELTVKRINGEPVVERADQYIWIDPDFAAEITDPATSTFAIGDVRYLVLGPSMTNPGALICERIAPPPDPIGPATLP